MARDVYAVVQNYVWNHFSPLYKESPPMRPSIHSTTLIKMRESSWFWSMSVCGDLKPAQNGVHPSESLW